MKKNFSRNSNEILENRHVVPPNTFFKYKKSLLDDLCIEILGKFLVKISAVTNVMDIWVCYGRMATVFTWRLSMNGTSTAGLTAACTNPNRNPQSQGKPKMRCAQTPTDAASAKQGRNDSNRTLLLSFLSAGPSNPSPARIRMTVRAIFRNTLDHFGLMSPAMLMPGTLRSINPTINMPSSGGSRISDTKNPPINAAPIKTIKANTFPEQKLISFLPRELFHTNQN